MGLCNLVFNLLCLPIGIGFLALGYFGITHMVADGSCGQACKASELALIDANVIQSKATEDLIITTFFIIGLLHLVGVFASLIRSQTLMGLFISVYVMHFSYLVINILLKKFIFQRTATWLQLFSFAIPNPNAPLPYMVYARPITVGVQITLFLLSISLLVKFKRMEVRHQQYREELKNK